MYNLQQRHSQIMNKFDNSKSQKIYHKNNLFIITIKIWLLILCFGMLKYYLQLNLLSQFEHRSILQQKHKTDQITRANIRKLNEQEKLCKQNPTNPQKKQKQSSNIAQNKFLLVIVIISVAIIVVGIICCTICIIRCIIKIQTGRVSTNNRIVNQIKTKYVEMCPEVQYWMFLEYVGNPLQDNCVICLEQFQLKKEQACRKNYIYEHFLQNSQNNYQHHSKIGEQKLEQQKKQNPRSMEYIEQNNSNNIPVKLTVCGHLFHSNCLDSWLMKQQNCPLCREQFTQVNLKKWQVKLGIQLLKSQFLNKKSIQNKNKSSPKAKEVIQQTIYQLSNYKQKQKYLQNISLTQLNSTQKQELIFYFKIMSFHKKVQGDFRQLSTIVVDSHHYQQQIYFISMDQQGKQGKNNLGVGRKISVDVDGNYNNRENNEINYVSRRRKTLARQPRTIQQI